MDCITSGFPVLHDPPGFTQTRVHRVGDVIKPSHPLSSPSPPALSLFHHQGLFQWVGDAILPSHLCRPLLLLPSIFCSTRVFSNELALRIKWPKYWSFSFNISPSNEHPGLISFRMDWLDLLADQGTLKSLLQHHSSKASILWRSAFFIVQLSHPNMTIGKTIALTIWTFVGKVISMSALFSVLEGNHSFFHY